MRDTSEINAPSVRGAFCSVLSRMETDAILRDAERSDLLRTGQALLFADLGIRMLERARLHSAIVDRLHSLRRNLASRAKLGLLDLHSYSEDFLCGLLNLVYDLNLVNLNAERVNFPGIDLADRNNRIAFQITADKTSKKLNETLIICASQGYSRFYDTIRFFLLTAKQRRYSLDIPSDFTIRFDIERDVLDFDAILRDVKPLPVAKIEEIHTYVLAELPPKELDAEESERVLHTSFASRSESGINERPQNAASLAALLFEEFEQHFDVLEYDRADRAATELKRIIIDAKNSMPETSIRRWAEKLVRFEATKAHLQKDSPEPPDLDEARKLLRQLKDD